MAPPKIGDGSPPGGVTPPTTPETLSPETSTESLPQEVKKANYRTSTDSLERGPRDSLDNLSSDTASEMSLAEPSAPARSPEAGPSQGAPLPPATLKADDIEALAALNKPISMNAELDGQYALETPVRQKGGTNQCWWLSFLETLRDLDILGDAFKTGSLVDKEPPDKKGKQVYGPKWQRTVMAHLKKQTGTDAWYKPEDTIQVSERPRELTRLLGLLGISNVTLKDPLTITPQNVDDKFAQLKVGQSVQVDKTNHAMSGVVVKREYTKKGKTKTRKVIEVYNQASGNLFDCRPQGKGLERRLKSSGGTEINFVIPIEIKPPDSE